MAQAQADTHVIETITDDDIWEIIADGVDAVTTKGETAFQFHSDRIVVSLKDPANVALIRMIIDPDRAFDHYAADGEYVIGIKTDRLREIIKAASGDDPIRFDLNDKTRRFEFESNGVEYELAGIDADTMTGTPTDVPPVKDEHDYTIFADVPVDKWAQGVDVVDLASSVGAFRYDHTTGEFYLEGDGDTDRSRVVLSDADGFNWRQDPPDEPADDPSPNTDRDVVESKQVVDYMNRVTNLLTGSDADDDVVKFVTGIDLPIHVWSSLNDGAIDMKYMQAPRR